jgi:hypothetical protein
MKARKKHILPSNLELNLKASDTGGNNGKNKDSKPSFLTREGEEKHSQRNREQSS